MNRSLSLLVPLLTLAAATNCSNDLENYTPNGQSGMSPTGGGTGGTVGGSAGSGTGGSSAATGGTGGSGATGGSTTGGAGGTGGTVGGSGGTGGTGGSVGGSGGMPAVGGSSGMPATGGSNPTGGSAGTGTGGSAGTGGASGAATGGAAGLGGMSTGGSAGAGGKAPTAGTGSGDTPLTINSDMFGAFDNAFMITACSDTGSGYDCPNRPGGGACSTTPWTWGTTTTTEATGTSYTEEFTVAGGSPDTIYDVKLHVLGQVEGRPYVNGMRQMSANVDPNGVNDLLYIGGGPGTDHNDYNVFLLLISGGTPITGAPTVYGFNAVDSGHAGAHYNFAVDSTFTIKVRSGMKVTLISHDSNCIAIKNCGSGGPYNYSSAAQCEANARATPASVTLPATFRGATIANPTKFQTQFLNFKVVSITPE
jgi:hypothetical protein